MDSNVVKSPHYDLATTLSNSDLVTHDPILIMGDSDFASQATAEGWSGNGTSGNPYVIEGYYIFDDSSIQIAHTRVSFVIRRCHLEYDSVAAITPCITTWNVTNAIIRDNVLVGNGMGMYLADTNDSLILNNTYTGISGSVAGIFLEYDITHSHFNIMANNTLTGVEVGIDVSPGCSNNTIEWNDLKDTLDSIRDNNPTEINTYKYNYYEEYSGTDADADGIGDPPFSIAPYFAYSDPYPLMYPATRPQWSDPPIDLTIPFGEGLSYDLNVTSSAPVQWWANHSGISIDAQGVIESPPSLAVGNYTVLVKVTNIYGRYLTGVFQLLIYDSTPPSWVIAPQDQTIVENEAFDYFVMASDKSEFSHWEINATLLFNITTAKDNEWLLLRIRNITTLTSGVYPLNLTVSDIHNNSLSTIFSLTVTPTTTATTTTTTSATTTTTTPPGAGPSFPIEVMAMILGGVGAAIVFLLVIWRLRMGIEN
jgi:parallel beta-helix repeat protein